jgi:hypothetical protein
MEREMPVGRPTIPATRARRPTARLLLGLALLGSSCLVGCGGCTQQTPAQKAAQEKKQREQEEVEAAKKKLEAEKKEPFVIGMLTPLLSETLTSVEDSASLRLAKPAHWTATVQPIKANLDDFDGRITLAAVDAKSRPLPLPHTPFEMTSGRPAVLAKGRTKRVESELLTPGQTSRLQVSSELFSRDTGHSERRTVEPWTLMPSYQYFLVVLAREPASYAYLKVADSTRVPFEDDNGSHLVHYRVVLTDANKPLPLPSNVLTWTSIAYIMWDEVNLDRMDPAQQQALVDWLHWGGRLVINGPDSLDALRGSFLADYLPADPGARVAFDAAALQAFSDAWTARSAGASEPKRLAVTRPWSGVELKPRPGAVALRGGEKLFYERSVGLGSIVVSAVQLAERDLVNWPGFDGFLNGALLRRPAREFVAETDGEWVGLQTAWAGFPHRIRDSYFTTPLRWFARDAGTTADVRQQTTLVDSAGAYVFGYDPAAAAAPAPASDRPGGLGDWSEFNPVSTAAREALAQAAGVRVPAAGFVVACLAVYLVVLAPLNWMVFHALNRVEWAWLSAPVIAIVGTIAVVRQAQLDIGFVRSQTEIGVLELHGGRPRGHLSRYTALYSSLSTTYDLEFADATAVAVPFPAYESFEPAIGDSLTPVSFEKYDKPRLRGVTISSAATQMIHSEQMFDLAGPIGMVASPNAAGPIQVENKSGYDLSDAVVIHRKPRTDGRAELRACWLGRMRNGATAAVPWSAARWKKGELPYAGERAEAATLDYRKRLNIDPLLQLALAFANEDDPIHGDREEWRLVARMDEVLPGATASPAASQSAGSSVVLVHLNYGPAPPPANDVNSPQDVAPDSRRTAYEPDSAGGVEEN